MGLIRTTILVGLVCMLCVACFGSKSSKPKNTAKHTATPTALSEAPTSTPAETPSVVAQNSSQGSQNAQSTAAGAKGAQGSRGYLTTPKELTAIRKKADDGLEPYHNAVKDVLDWADQDWDFPLDAAQGCPDANHPQWLDNQGGIPILYAKALAYHLTGDEQYANDVKTILQRIMTKVLQISLSEQQCRLDFSWGTPELVASADLIEGYWHDKTCNGPVSTAYDNTQIGSGNCKQLFQNWLIKNPYYVVSYTAETAQSNWGASSTNTLAYIADYLADRPAEKLVHRTGDAEDKDVIKTITLTPAQAYARANQLMFDRMNGYGVDYFSSSACSALAGSQQNSQWPPVKSQITEKGIVPEDARRQEFCNIPQYSGEYENYPQLHLGSNIQQCELMLRRGDSACFDNVDNTDIPNFSYKYSDGETKVTHLYPGRGSIERAIDAIIIDSHTEWRHDSALAVAYRYYSAHHRLPGTEQWLGQIDKFDDCAQDICFGVLTHGFSPDEAPGLPPVTKPVK
ncbi:MAG: hypothetical protein U0350_45235 [Caldilineaceae bacterium]